LGAGVTANDARAEPATEWLLDSGFSRQTAWGQHQLKDTNHRAGPHRTGAERQEIKPISSSMHSDPAECRFPLRLFYRGWRPTRMGRWVNRLAIWWAALAPSSKELAILEVPGRTSGQRRLTPVVIATV
jgi:hypothetical protein